jgi:hypothetical protein
MSRMTDIESGMLVEWVYGDYQNPPGPRPLMGLVTRVYQHGRWVGGIHYEPRPIAEIIWLGEERAITVDCRYVKPHASFKSTPGAVPNNIYSKHNK